MLEFLTEYEVEVAAAAFSIYLVKAVAPVNTHHADHRQDSEVMTTDRSPRGDVKAMPTHDSVSSSTSPSCFSPQAQYTVLPSSKAAMRGHR